MTKKILITGGKGFIGSHFVKKILKEKNWKILNIDKNLNKNFSNRFLKNYNSENYIFKTLNINDTKKLGRLFEEYKPNIVINFAAETHVDRSITDPDSFIENNIMGTFNLLEISRKYLSKKKNKKDFLFYQISTDEVFGELTNIKSKFDENSNYSPNSPYSASKASADHLVNAWIRTYNLPAVISHCSNNYGSFQAPEKLIPRTIIRALNKKKILVYGKGKQIRDWLHVEDHIDAIMKIIAKPEIGGVYMIGGGVEKTNLSIVKLICKHLDELVPLAKNSKINKYSDLIYFTDDRPGHDFRYAIDNKKFSKSFNWKPKINLDLGLKETVLWYTKNYKWMQKYYNNKF